MVRFQPSFNTNVGTWSLLYLARKENGTNVTKCLSKKQVEYCRNAIKMYPKQSQSNILQYIHYLNEKINTTR
jgi:hypothetical protein